MQPEVDHLIARLGRGDRTAFEPLVLATSGPLHRFVRALLPREPQVDEVLQETYLAILSAAPGFRGESSARSWLYGIARRQAARARRTRAGEPSAPESLEALGELAGWGEDPEAAVARAEGREHLRAAIERLNAGDQEILALRDLEGLTNEETAHALGLELAATKSRIHRARLHLMAALRHPEAP